MLQRSLFILLVFAMSAIAPSLAQAANFSSQAQKLENPTNRVLIAQSDEEYVSTIWYNILGRPIDDRGIGMHVQILSSGQQTRQQMRENIARSQESQMRINDIYQRYLYRDATTAQKRAWTYRLGRGEVTTFDVESALQNYVNNGGK